MITNVYTNNAGREVNYFKETYCHPNTTHKQVMTVIGLDGEITRYEH